MSGKRTVNIWENNSYPKTLTLNFYAQIGREIMQRKILEKSKKQPKFESPKTKNI